MSAELTPMRWPASWKDPARLGLLSGTAINFLLVENLPEIDAGARAAGIPTGRPDGVSIVSGLWPGIRLSQGGGNNVASGPTGVPWVDSNGWRVRLAAALQPGKDVWIDAAPKAPRMNSAAYVTAFADAAAAGGRWILTLDDKLAAGIAAREPEALDTWEQITGAAGFFRAHRGWNSYEPRAVVGVISDFAGPVGGEVLNLIGRGNQQYRVMPKDKLAKASFRELQAVIYLDAAKPAEDTRAAIAAFVESGGLLITGPAWGEANTAATTEEHPHFRIARRGQGRIAISEKPLADPYVLANDTAVLISHRNELLRFWNGGAVSSYYSTDADGKRAVVQMVFYARRSTDDAAVRIAGNYRAARLITLEKPEPREIHLEAQKDAVEIHLPSIAHYAAVELTM